MTDELFWDFLGLILLEFLCLLRVLSPVSERFVKMFLVLLQCILHYFFFHNKSSSPGGYFGVFFGQFCGIFFYFLRTVWFLMKFCTYILDNTLMAVIRKDFMGGGGCSPLLGAILSLVFWGEGHIFSIFL